MVSSAGSEALLTAIAARTADPVAGIFGPGSLSWKVNRESALFLGAGRAALLQLAHPWVATALDQHSSLLTDPIGRFHNTFRIIFTMIFGSLPQALAAARHLYRLHTTIQGELPEDLAGYRRGSRYQANEISALRWVYATLVESAVVAYECVLPPLTPDELASYYAESKIMAGLFGLPEAALPQTWPDFVVYVGETCASNDLGVSEEARRTAHSLLAGAGSWIRPPLWYRALTTGWMPPRFRDEFSLEFRDGHRQAAERARGWLRSIYRRLPTPVRFVGPWQEAQARLSGRRAGPLSWLSNRFWLGEPLLPFAAEPVSPILI